MTPSLPPPAGPIDEGLSAKLRALSMLGIVMVIVGHSPSFRDPSAPSARSEPYATVEYVVGDCLPRIAVMMFFAVSGFLMFTGHDGRRATHARKVASRMRSMVVPYLTWSALSLAVYYALQVLPWTSAWFSNPARRVVDRSVPEILGFWLLDPIAYQLWFLRDLIILALLSPVLHAVLSRGGVAVVVILGIASLCDLSVPGPFHDVNLLTCDGYFYFAVGGWFALKRVPLTAPRRAGLPLVVMVLVVALTRGWLVARSGGGVQQQGQYQALERVVYLAGVPALWILYDARLRWLERPALQRFAGLAFFAFVAHEPFMTMLRKPIVRVFGTGDLCHAVELVLSLTLTVVVVASVGALLRARLPRVYAFLCGGRDRPAEPAAERAPRPIGA